MVQLVAAVQGNCNIADARHAREVTLCTYLLGMRELYRWEHDIPFGIAPPRAEVGRWIGEREALWEDLTAADYTPIPLAAAAYDPFDVAAINQALAGSGLVYGAGIGRFAKPHFFLARLGRRERRGSNTLLVCECEYARDIAAIPAALQGDTIIVRHEAMRQWLWEKAEGWGVKRQEGALQAALAAHGFDADPNAAIESMLLAETETLVLHEEGEQQAAQWLEPTWGQRLAGLDNRAAEILLRAVRDNLADCLSTLPALLARQAWPSLQLWLANFDGLRRELFPALATLGGEFAKLGAGEAAPAADRLHALLQRGACHWQTQAQNLMQIPTAELEGLARQPHTIAL